MPFDGSAFHANRPQVRATYADLTPDQRARYGSYVAAKDAAISAMEANRERSARAGAALIATGGDTLAALGLMLSGKVA